MHVEATWALPQASQHKLKAEAEQRIDEAHAALQSHLHSSDSAQDKLKEAERQRRALERRISEVNITCSRQSRPESLKLVRGSSMSGQRQEMIPLDGINEEMLLLHWHLVRGKSDSWQQKDIQHDQHLNFTRVYCK